ncbi:MAG: hypothetical protein ACOYT7_00460 [Patescibacteria group bacterium]
MESLASLFVSLVVVANSFFPKVGLPQRLGVNLGTSSVLSEDTTSEVEAEASTPSGTSANLREALEARKNALEEARRERKEALERAREAREAAMDAAKTAREEFKERLREIRNERKRKVVERIDENIAKHNEKWVEHWNRVLSRLREILAKIQTRADKLAAVGKDVSKVNSAISAAESLIAEAQSAVDAQAGKTYVIEITDEETLGENVSRLVQDFRNDVKSVIEKVQAARKGVRDAFKELKAIFEVESSESPSPTP